jgi:quercetin dioxygenase-like cupin family protein
MQTFDAVTPVTNVVVPSRSMSADFVIRAWRLDPYEGDQAPPHIHYSGEEAFICLDGDLSVTLDGVRTAVPAGAHLVVPRGTPHTFASPRGAHVLAVMSPEIADLIDGLHADLSDDERAALWERHRSSLV